MNKDIRLSVSFFHHPKTIKLISLLGEHGVLSILRLWCYAGQWKQSGDLSSMSHEEIECAALFNGPHGKFVESLIEVRYLDENLQLHDWEEHNPYAFYAPIRRIKAQISAHLKHGDVRAADRLRKTHGLDAKRMRNAKRTHANRNAPIPSPIPIPIPSPKRKQRPAQVPFEIPIFIPKDTWEAFEEMRSKLRKPLTDRGRKLICDKLLSFRDTQGHDPEKVLNQSIENSWQGVFPLKEVTSVSSARTGTRNFPEERAQQRAERNARILARGNHVPGEHDPKDAA